MKLQTTVLRNGLLATCCLVAAPAVAATITIPLDDVTVGACGTPWHEASCPLWFAPTTAEDEYPGYCLFNADMNHGGHEGVYIWPARLVLDLSEVSGVETVEVDVYEAHVPGSTRAFLYHEGGLVDYAQSDQTLTHTLTLDAAGGAVDQFAVSAHESAVWEIRLIGVNVTPIEGTSFGKLKSIFR